MASGRFELVVGSPGVRPVMVECTCCLGSGRHRLSKRGMAELCGIAHNSWGPSHQAVLVEETRLLMELRGSVMSQN